MKPLKYLIAIAALTGALGLSAKANVITDLGEHSLANQNPGTVLAFANANGVDADEPTDGDLVSAGRITGTSGGTITNSFGTFTLTVNSSNLGFLTFTMNDSFVLAGVAVHAGGGQLTRFFTINDETAGVAEGPFFGHIMNGKAQAFSNFDIFVEQGAAPTPDGGATVMLLGAALTGLGLVRRYLKH
jgi:hypothetical protein